ncbi:MAG: hypothetical protein ACE5G3_06060 [Gammaproteobacteria bacterium]
MSSLEQALPAARLLGCAVGVMAVLSGGCSTVPADEPLRQRLDNTSGATVTTLAEPMAFFREEPTLAANLRDYIYVGPVEVNRSGRRVYLLWTAFSSTIDRGGRAVVLAPEAAYLMLDGELMELARTRGRLDLGIRLYEPPIPTDQIVVYRMTRAQFLAIARAGEVLFIADHSAARETAFASWRDSVSDWRRFSRYIDGANTIAGPIARAHE